MLSRIQNTARSEQYQRQSASLVQRPEGLSILSQIPDNEQGRQGDFSYPGLVQYCLQRLSSRHIQKFLQIPSQFCKPLLFGAAVGATAAGPLDPFRQIGLILQAKIEQEAFE